MLLASQASHEVPVFKVPVGFPCRHCGNIVPFQVPERLDLLFIDVIRHEAECGKRKLEGKPVILPRGEVEVTVHLRDGKVETFSMHQDYLADMIRLAPSIRRVAVTE